MHWKRFRKPWSTIARWSNTFWMRSKFYNLSKSMISAFNYSTHSRIMSLFALYLNWSRVQVLPKSSLTSEVSSAILKKAAKRGLSFTLLSYCTCLISCTQGTQLFTEIWNLIIWWLIAVDILSWLILASARSLFRVGISELILIVGRLGIQHLKLYREWVTVSQRTFGPSAFY